MPDGCTDLPYLDALDMALASAFDRCTDPATDQGPGLAFYLAGADPHENDRLGRLKVSAAGLAERDRRVFAALASRDIPVAVSMAGGYGRELATTVAIQRRTIELAFESWRARRATAAIGAGGDTVRQAAMEQSGA